MVGRLYIHTSCVQVSSSQPRQQRRCAPLFQRSGMEVVVKRSLRCKTLGKWDINGICAINQHHSIWRQKNKLKWSFIRLEIFDFDFRGGFEDTSPNIILHILPFSIPLGSQQQNAASCPRPDSYHHSEEPSCHLLHCGERREPSFQSQGLSLQLSLMRSWYTWIPPWDSLRIPREMSGFLQHPFWVHETHPEQDHPRGCCKTVNELCYGWAQAWHIAGGRKNTLQGKYVGIHSTSGQHWGTKHFFQLLRLGTKWHKGFIGSACEAFLTANSRFPRQNSAIWLKISQASLESRVTEVGPSDDPIHRDAAPACKHGQWSNQPKPWWQDVTSRQGAYTRIRDATWPLHSYHIKNSIV